MTQWKKGDTAYIIDEDNLRAVKVEVVFVDDLEESRYLHVRPVHLSVRKAYRHSRTTRRLSSELRTDPDLALTEYIEKNRPPLEKAIEGYELKIRTLHQSAANVCSAAVLELSREYGSPEAIMVNIQGFRISLGLLSRKANERIDESRRLRIARGRLALMNKRIRQMEKNNGIKRRIAQRQGRLAGERRGNSD